MGTSEIYRGYDLIPNGQGFSIKYDGQFVTDDNGYQVSKPSLLDAQIFVDKHLRAKRLQAAKDNGRLTNPLKD